jgi:hypothetical protein
MASQVSRVDHLRCNERSTRTAWPLLRGLMSRKAYVFSLSKSFMDGISPAGSGQIVIAQHLSHRRAVPTLDDLAENARGCHVGLYERWV